MKRFLNEFNRHAIYRILFCMIFLSVSFFACKKTETPVLQSNENSSNLQLNNNASQFSSEVIDKWITMQLRLDRDAVGIANVAFSRYYAYSGVAAFAALGPGTQVGSSFSEKLRTLISMPQTDKSALFYLPASVNTALAFMNRNMYTTATAADTAAIDSLETALNNSFISQTNPEVLALSNAYGKEVATAVFNWSETDGYKHASDPYIPPIGPGLWVPKPPSYAPASTPYWGNNRPIISGDIDNTQPGAPIAYSETPGSPFYQMVNQLYQQSHHLTPDDSAQAFFWRDIPGVSSPGHWLSILQQVIQQTNSHLDKAAFAYALTGTCLSDACISCWKTKYQYNLLRPVTYIRNVIKDTTWNAVITTPAHPEYSCAHCVLSAATADALTEIFGNIGSFTDHTYDYLGFAPRTYSSFNAIADEAGHSRFYGGIHYKPSIDTGLLQGRKVSANILRMLNLH